ncbi:uncharacterized protein LOC135389628 [Ornithodoros turicata]|uniref:uncharacterized protein LOC135389628 n=1 Tax=Ornithodoros turicata TaxID=34597 RepID=UPI0031391D34
MSLRRFVARRGVPTTIYSDNARSFKRADKGLRALWNTTKDLQVNDYLTHQNITWRYILPGAPWWGGWWERLVRTVKTALRKVLGKTSLGFEELRTVMTEVEAVVNSRPLTYASCSPDDSNVLCPSHFLVGKRVIALPTQPATQHDDQNQSTKDQLTRKMLYREKLMQHFWRRCRRQYLLQLRSAHHFDSTSSKRLLPGDVVVIESNRPRNLWDIGRIMETYEGQDGHVRSCLLKRQDGKTTKTPAQHLYHLEV